MRGSTPCTCCRPSTSPRSRRTRPQQADARAATSRRTRRTRPSSRPASTASAAKDGFNWGYDPLHYMAPEGRTPRPPRDGGSAGGGVPHDGRRRCTGTACGSCSTRCSTTPPTSGQGRQVRARPGGAGLLPAARPAGRGRDLDLLPERRDRARHGREADGRLGGTVGARLQGRRLPLRPDGPPLEGEHARRPGRPRRAHAEEGRRRREVGLPLRRGLELRRGRRRRPFEQATPGPARRHRHRHVLRPAARRRPRRRPVRRRPAHAGLRLGRGTDPNGDARPTTATRRPGRTTPTWSSSGWPATCGPSRSGQRDGDVARGTRSTTTASRPATPTSRTRSSATSTRTTTRRCGTR